MKKIVLIFSLFIISLPYSFCQKTSSNYLTYSAGLGLHSQSNYLSGAGVELNLGYRHELKNNRLSIHPFISIGAYQSGKNDNDRDKYFNTLTLNISSGYDLIRYKSISLNLGVGGFFGLTKGLYGTGNEFQSSTSTDIIFEQSKFIDKTNYGFVLNSGIRIAKPTKKYAFNIIPLSLKIGNNELVQLNSLIQLDIKL